MEEGCISSPSAGLNENADKRLQVIDKDEGVLYPSSI